MRAAAEGIEAMAHAPKDRADAAQLARFVEAAKDLECDDSEEAFERTFAKVVPARRPGEVPPSQADAKARAKAPKRAKRDR